MESVLPITHFELDLTNHCNLRCEYCFHHGELDFPKGFMDTDLALRIIDEVADKRLSNGVSTSIFGEALLHKDFFKIARHALDRGLELTLNTNGALLDSEICDKVFQLSPTKLFISLNTPDETKFELKHASGNLSFEEYMERIKEAIRAKFRLRSPTRIFLYVLNTFFQEPRGLQVLDDDDSAKKAVQYFCDMCRPIAYEFGFADDALFHRVANLRYLLARVDLFNG